MRKIPVIPIVLNIVALAVIAGTMLFIVNHKKPVVHGGVAQSAVYHCPMHPNYLTHQAGKCPICGMDLVVMETADPQKAAAGTTASVKIDPAMIQSMGVQTEKAALRTLTKDIRTTATVMPDERRVTIITTKIMGYVEKLYVNYTGQQVKAGQPLYDLYSPELVSAQSEYLQTYKNSAVSDSGQLLGSARQRLLNWDITEAQITALEKRGIPEKNITIVSPAAGTVAEKMVVEGQNIEPGMPLYRVIDYSHVWVECAVYQQDIPLVQVGQHGSVELDYYPGMLFEGTLTYSAPELTAESRTLMARFELANTPDFKIKPGMNATVTLHTVINRNAVTVPDQAVLHSGLHTIVVIALGGGYFEPREVVIGHSAGGYTEIIEGVSVNDEIVVSSQFLIDSESNLKTAVMKMDHGAASATSQPGSASKNAVQTNDTLAGSDPQRGHQNAVDTAGVPAGQIYTCPMDPEIVSDKPASCPKCGMMLVLKKP